eukprot:Amastigsp_a339217_1581.p2 type:complete len:123 gc:universal Amastigsp_a339217_1581:430-798(+)
MEFYQVGCRAIGDVSARRRGSGSLEAEHGAERPSRNHRGCARPVKLGCGIGRGVNWGCFSFRPRLVVWIALLAATQSTHVLGAVCRLQCDDARAKRVVVHPARLACLKGRAVHARRIDLPNT